MHFPFIKYLYNTIAVSMDMVLPKSSVRSNLIILRYTNFIQNISVADELLDDEYNVNIGYGYRENNTKLRSILLQ
jgi:hypothetical protein